MRIQHNIFIISAYCNYNTNTSALAKNLEKLSSGYKINRAGDDAAGQPVEAKVQISSLKADACGSAGIGGLLHAQGADTVDDKFDVNIKDAFSVANVASGATLSSGDQITLTVTIGGATVTVKATYSGASLVAGAAISVSDLNFSCTQTSVTVGTSGDGYKVTIDASKIATDGTLTFSRASDQAKIDYDLNLEVKIEDSGSLIEFTNPNADRNPSKTSFDCHTQNITHAVAQKGTQPAHGHLEITEDIVKALEAGGTLTIADKNITFDLEHGSTATTDELVGVKDLLDADGKVKTDAATIKELCARLSVAANGNEAFRVGVSTDGKTLTLQEKINFYDPDSSKDEDLLDTEVKFQAKVSCYGASTSGNALTFQIGDTSDRFNQMALSIGNMHTNTMISSTTGKSIADIDISTQTGAQAAIQTIRDVINYVSSVRGDLGAIQSRLEHTANNLSVMAKNIQDAEPTIRDTDIAEEMMAYTKNNILVQSAQAMLAQANAVPQGVLQLLG